MKWDRLIIKSIGALGVLQMTNYLVPILVIPLLLSRVGLESYGMIVLAQGIMNFAVAIADFGLNLTGTRLISLARGDLVLERSITQKILVIKVFLLLVTFVGLSFFGKNSFAMATLRISNFDFLFYCYWECTNACLVLSRCSKNDMVGFIEFFK